jgi:hypothetical protein
LAEAILTELFTPPAAGGRDLPRAESHACGYEAAGPLWRTLSICKETRSVGEQRGTDSDQPMTTPLGPLSPERRLALLRDIRDGGYTLRAGPSPEAQAVLAVKLAEWRELDNLQDIRLRTIPETTAAGERLRMAIAIITLTGLRFLAEHVGESDKLTQGGRAG